LAKNQLFINHKDVVLCVENKENRNAHC